MIEKSSGNFIGWSGLKYMQQTTNGKINFHEVGYRLLQKHWGKGYATESAKAAVNYGFEEMKLNEIYGITNVENINSRKVLEKCGLTFIETFVWEGWNNIECNWLKITKEEWENRNTY
jgi:RimJ/RimL family protein N-acetyltransferase